MLSQRVGEIVLITLKEIRNIFGSDLSILETKKILNVMKKEGVLFFQENLSNQKELSRFELYYCLFPSKTNTQNAFPIPIKYFCFHKHEIDSLYFMQNYYNNYYSTNIKELSFFKEYDSKRPFVGKNYLWYFRSHLNGTHINYLEDIEYEP
jgi:hypothetical protein